MAPSYYVRVHARPNKVASSTLGPYESLLDAVKAVYDAKLEHFSIEQRADDRDQGGGRPGEGRRGESPAP